MKWFIRISLFLIAAPLVARWWVPIDFEVAANVSLIYFAAGVTVFAVRYAFWSNWRASDIGPVYLAFKSWSAVVLWQIVVATWIDADFPFRQEIRYVIYSVGAVMSVPMINVLVGIQNRRVEGPAVVADIDQPPIQG